MNLLEIYEKKKKNISLSRVPFLELFALLRLMRKLTERRREAVELR